MTTERWLPVVGFEGLYEVSDQGRVRSVTRTVHFRSGQIRTFPGVVMKLSPGTTGYLIVILSRQDERRTRKVHRLVAEAFLGPAPAPRMDVAHNDGTRTNNALANLRWTTRSDNLMDKVGHGTHNRGEQHPTSVLVTEQVLEIREAVARGETHRSVAERYGIASPTVSAIVYRKTWAWLPPRTESPLIEGIAS